MFSHDEVVAILKDFATMKSHNIDFSDQKTIHDRILVVEGKKFYVQSGLLMVWSEFFQGLFGQNFKEAHMEEIEIKEVSAEDFENFLTLIYDFKINVTNYLGLARLSDRFLAPVVYDKVKEFISKNFASLDKIELLKFAFEHDKEDIKKLVAIFITCNLGTSPLLGRFICSDCKMPYDAPPFCIHASNINPPLNKLIQLTCKKPLVNSWIHDNITQILELPLEI